MGGDIYTLLSNTIPQLLYPRRSAILRKYCLCQDFLKEIHPVEPKKNVICQANTYYN